MREKPVWRPSATLQTLRARARLLATIRAHFARQGVMEVDTPALSAAATVDRHIESFQVEGGYWLHTSAEFAMKRLLAAGSGPIYQLCHVFRKEEAGRHHQPEFTMLEWYRPGFDHLQLMDEVETLARALGAGGDQRFERLTYRDAFGRHAGFDPFTVTPKGVRAKLQRLGVVPVAAPPESDRSDLDFWLDLTMSVQVAPKLGLDAPCFVYDYPASQCALARIDAGVPAVALRFELFWRGVELANGYHELTDAEELERRFQQELEARRRGGRRQPPMDRALIAAQAYGLQEVAGVAIGIDRLLMLLLDLPTVAETQAFDHVRA